MADYTDIRETVRILSSLSFMTPAQLELMETCREVILSYASELEAFENSFLSNDDVRIFTGLHDVSHVQGVRLNHAIFTRERG